jgi:hypothetical protein
MGEMPAGDPAPHTIHWSEWDIVVDFEPTQELPRALDCVRLNVLEPYYMELPGRECV